MLIDIINNEIGFGGIVSQIDLTKTLSQETIKNLDDALNNLCFLVFTSLGFCTVQISNAEIFFFYLNG